MLSPNPRGNAMLKSICWRKGVSSQSFIVSPKLSGNAAGAARTTTQSSPPQENMSARDAADWLGSLNLDR